MAGRPDLTDPVPESIVQPKLPPGVHVSPGTRLELSLNIVVNEDGSVGSISVSNWPEGPERIVVPAVRAVRTWRYKPGLMDGDPVKVSLPVKVVFEP